MCTHPRECLTKVEGHWHRWLCQDCGAVVTSRQAGINPRALGTNPKALGTNPNTHVRNKYAFATGSVPNAAD